MFNKVQTDLLKKHTGPFLFCFFTMMFILLMQFLILYVDILVGKGLPFSIVIELIATNLAHMVVLATPIAVLVSTLMAFGKFSEWNELTAIRAAGINPIRLMTPVLFVGVLLFIFTAYFSNYILPEANHKARSLFLDIRMQKPAFDLQPGVFYEDIDGYTFLAREINSETDSLYDVRVFQEEAEDRYRAFISAKRGILESPDENTLSLILYDGTTMRYIEGSSRGGETLEQNSFNRYRMSFDLSELAFSRSNPDQRSRTDRTMSAQAMLAVIDTLRQEQQIEYARFRETTSQQVETPYHYDRSGTIYMADDALDDTLQIYQSKFQVLNIIPNPGAQINSVNRAINSLDRYRPELESLRSNLEWRETRVAEFAVEVHKKLSIPFACVVFVFLGAPIGMLTKKGNLGYAVLTSAMLITLYFIAIIQGEKLADRLIISPASGMWMINIAYLAAGLLLTLYVCTTLKFSNLWSRRKNE